MDIEPIACPQHLPIGSSYVLFVKIAEQRGKEELCFAFGCHMFRAVAYFSVARRTRHRFRRPMNRDKTGHTLSEPWVFLSILGKPFIQIGEKFTSGGDSPSPIILPSVHPDEDIGNVVGNDDHAIKEFGQIFWIDRLSRRFRVEKAPYLVEIKH